MEPIGLVQWRTEYESGIEEIDRQHKDIINTLNKIYWAIEDNKAEGRIQELLNAFDFYETEHFKLEEDYAEKYNFPRIKELKNSHNFFKTTYKQLRQHYNERVEIFQPEVQEILHLHSIMNKWLSIHLITLDKELFDFLREKIPPSP
ncbi:MAG: hypothetical protein A2Y25_06780 [Candidatus Melainabacteria bacterium GWF2_37_15]|nr:MAG: hypothetical protein A2Y25_06780 [Candidatus Melainabacteria bacterium GWF2_37_15]